MSRCRWFVLFIVMSRPVWAAEPGLVTSIKPVQLLTAAIAGDQARPAVLLGGNDSPHHYQLRPSAMGQLQRADLVIWIGPGMETFLVDPLRTLAAKRVLRLAPATGETAPARHDHGHDHGAGDWHYWLSPVLALDMAEKIARRLSSRWPDRQGAFSANLRDFRQALLALDGELQQAFAPLRQRGFIVQHAAYGHFVEHYELRQLAAVQDSPERQAGARHLAQLTELVASGEVVCALTESRFRAKTLDQLLAGSNVNRADVDPLAADVAVDAQGFIRFFRRFADKVRDCLTVAGHSKGA